MDAHEHMSKHQVQEAKRWAALTKSESNDFRQARTAPPEPVNARLLDVATGKTPHLYEGRCPDSINGPDSRDPACPACRAIAEADADLKLENILHKFGEADFPPGYCLDPMCSREEMEAQQEKPKD